jgi:hypothetical protein
VLDEPKQQIIYLLAQIGGRYISDLVDNRKLERRIYELGSARSWYTWDDLYKLWNLMTITRYGSPLLTLCIGGLLTFSLALRHIICVWRTSEHQSGTNKHLEVNQAERACRTAIPESVMNRRVTWTMSCCKQTLSDVPQTRSFWSWPRKGFNNLY